MAAGPQRNPAEQSVGGKVPRVTPVKQKGFKTRMNVWCFATTKSHVRAAITSQLVKYVS